MPQSSPSEVFLSHATTDARLATEIAATLRSHGIPVWYSRTELVGAQQWHDEIGEALARCDWFIVLVSTASVESMWVRREVQYVLSQRRYEGRIVPVLLEPCKPERLSWVIPTLQLVDFTDALEAGYRNLLRVWGIGYRPDH